METITLEIWNTLCFAKLNYYERFETKLNDSDKGLWHLFVNFSNYIVYGCKNLVILPLLVKSKVVTKFATSFFSQYCATLANNSSIPETYLFVDIICYFSILTTEYTIKKSILVNISLPRIKEN